MPKSKKLEAVRDWTPRALPGGKYCSPACGGAKGWCRRSDFDRATREAADLAAQLGDGWVPHVWENMGWHWQVAKGPMAEDRIDGGGVIVRKDQRSRRYSAEFRSAMTGTRTVTQFFADADEPEEAIGRVRQDVRTFITRIESDLADSI